MAAAYVFHIVKNHPFIDGNKRTGAVAGFLFLKMNGADIVIEESEFEELVRHVACGLATKKHVAERLRVCGML